MSTVNVDAHELQSKYFLCMNARHVAGDTKIKLLKKLSVLGASWNDKKYEALHGIVDECCNALSKMEAGVLDGAHILGQLINYIQQYEQTCFTSYIASNDPAYPSNYEQRIQDSKCCGVTIVGGELGGQYRNCLEARYANAEVDVRQAFDNLAGTLVVQNCQVEITITPHYNPAANAQMRGVYYNAFSDNINRRGVGQTYYHELGHMLDHAAGGFNGFISDTPAFCNALIQDAQNILDLYHGLSPSRQTAFIDKLREDTSHSASDLLGALTGGELCGRYGHGAEYWTNAGNIQAEAFAHFVESSMGAHDKLELLVNLFPQSYEAFQTMIYDINSGQHLTRVLTRRR